MIDSIFRYMRRFLKLKYKTRMAIILPICVFYYLGLGFIAITLLKIIYRGVM